MVIACVALGVALSGTGIAATVALAPNSVGTLQLKANAVTTQKVKNGTLLRGDFKAGQIPRRSHWACRPRRSGWCRRPSRRRRTRRAERRLRSVPERAGRRSRQL